MSSVLYVVATPIGNLEDISPRAIRILKEADLILAEDTRVTRKLLTAFDIKTPLESHHLHNESEKAAQVIARMQERELQVALVSDAGTPAISDPGALLVGLAHQAGIEVVAIPGPSALVSALSKSGFTQGAFAFYGFLPRKSGELKAALTRMAGGPTLAVIYESPHRVMGLLAAIKSVYPDSRLSLSRELSKRFEQTFNGKVEELQAKLQANPGLLRGEFALVLELPEKQESGQSEQVFSLEAQLTNLLVQGLDLRQAQTQLIAQGQRKNTVYAAALRLKELADSLLEIK